jgi:hypothetical protein
MIAFFLRWSSLIMRGSIWIALVAAMAGCSSQTKEAGMSCCDAPAGKLRHVVLFKFKPGTSPEAIASVERAFGELPSKIPQIIDYEWGTNVSPEGHDKGYTHCFLVTFADAAGRDAYLPHPAHQDFVKILRPHLEEAHVIDYFVRP